MVKIRLRTKFLLSLIFTTAVLTGTSLLIVQSYAGKHARQDIDEQVENSLLTFHQFAQQRQRMLAQSAQIAASQANVKALMNTQNGPTIQDASSDFSVMAGADLILLANATGKVMALHTANDFNRELAQASLSGTLGRRQSRDWWFGSGHLYEVYLQPIYFGSPLNQVLLGVLATGFEVDQRLATWRFGTERQSSPVLLRRTSKMNWQRMMCSPAFERRGCSKFVWGQRALSGPRSNCRQAGPKP